MARAAVLVVPALAVLGALPVRAEPPRWRLAAEAPISHKASVALFTDERNGITAGHAGAMYVTHDGGRSWSPAANTSACRFGLEAVPGAAFTAGNQGNVRRSTDGGEHWSAVASFGRTEPGHARFLSFADAGRGLIATPDALALTRDGAATWIPLVLPGKVGLIAAVSAADEGGALRLRVLDEGGRLFASADGGRTWSEERSPLAHPVMESLTTPWAALRFRGAEGLLAAFTDEDGGPVGHVYRTRDGGMTWAEEQPAEPLRAGTPAFSPDGELLTTCDSRAVRVYRVN